MRHMSSREAEVMALKARHDNMWHDKPEWYWVLRFLEEICELLLSLIRLHKDAPEHELRQIAAIAINWLEMRDERRVEQ